MKTRPIVICVILLFTLTACPITEKPDYRREYIIRNDTEFDADVRFCSSNTRRLISQRALNRGEQLSNKTSLRMPFDDSHKEHPQSAFSGDSVRIIINNKCLIYSFLRNGDSVGFSEPENRNIFKHENYEYLSGNATDIGGERYLFKITMKDYERAQDLDKLNE